jgi:hypothetical protein
VSLPAEPLFDIPERTVEIARAAFPKGNICIQMRDELGNFCQDEQFIDLFSHAGQPALTPCRLALVSVMPFAENLTHRQERPRDDFLRQTFTLLTFCVTLMIVAMVAIASSPLPVRTQIENLH